MVYTTRYSTATAAVRTGFPLRQSSLCVVPEADVSVLLWLHCRRSAIRPPLHPTSISQDSRRPRPNLGYRMYPHSCMRQLPRLRRPADLPRPHGVSGIACLRCNYCFMVQAQGTSCKAGDLVLCHWCTFPPSSQTTHISLLSIVGLFFFFSGPMLIPPFRSFPCSRVSSISVSVTPLSISHGKRYTTSADPSLSHGHLSFTLSSPIHLWTLVDSSMYEKGRSWSVDLKRTRMEGIGSR